MRRTIKRRRRSSRSWRSRRRSSTALTPMLRRLRPSRSKEEAAMVDGISADEVSIAAIVVSAGIDADRVIRARASEQYRRSRNRRSRRRSIKTKNRRKKISRVRKNLRISATKTFTPAVRTSTTHKNNGRLLPKVPAFFYFNYILFLTSALIVERVGGAIQFPLRPVFDLEDNVVAR